MKKRKKKSNNSQSTIVKKKSAVADLSTNKRRAFYILLILIPVMFFVFLETGLRIFDYGDNLSLFLKGKDEFSDYMYINRWVAKRYFNLEEAVPDPSNDIFLRVKPDNGYRIFVIGGSTAAGWPYGNNLMFSRILQKRLSDSFPDKHIEIINTSISAINSYSMLDFLDDIFDYEPDAILIYGGHNEYYGVMGVASTQSLGNINWIKRSYLTMNKFKLFHLLKNSLAQLSELIGVETDTEDKAGTMMERLVAEQKIEYGGELYESGKEQFQYNLSRIFDKAIDEGVKIIISELVSNVKDQKPFISDNNSDSNSAAQFYEEAKLLEAEKKYSEANKVYLRAKDNDLLRFRAPEDFNTIINKTAAKYNIPVVPLLEEFRNNSPYQLIDNSLMVDHLHPNIKGYFILADGFFNVMREQRYISESWDTSSFYDSDYYLDNWGISQLDIVYSDLRIEYLKGGWPFKPAGEINESLKQFNLQDRITKTAYRVWQDRSYTLEDGHADLAEYYESKNMYELAFQEYNALTCLKPYNYTAYLKAAETLIKSGNRNRALPFLYSSLDLNKTAFAYKWIGLIYFDQGLIEKSLTYLEEVYKLDIKDSEIMFTMSLAYFQKENISLAKKFFDELKKIDPEFPRLNELETKLNL